jgi:hypothetical protein
MQLTLNRFKYSDKSTIGRLMEGDEELCYTLEDVVRPKGVKVPGDTAIPEGTYKVIKTFSPKFNREMPLLCDVPNYDGVRIHWGNTDADTEGCVLVGQTFSDDFIGHSRDAFGALWDKLDAAWSTGEMVYITIRRDPAASS